MSAPHPLELLARELGVTAESLARLGVQRNGSAWRIPERDADGNVIGHSLRRDDGRKLCEAGSKRGLTLAWPLAPYAGTSRDEPVLVVEGMSDTAAGLDLGFTVVGRPSATGGLDHLRMLLHDRHVVVVGENDNGAGRAGAEKIAQGLADAAVSVRVVFPPVEVKDLRQWKAADLTCESLRAAIAPLEPVEPDRLAQSPMMPAAAARVPAFEPFPMHALPQPFRGFVELAAEGLGCDRAFVALPALSACAAAIGNSRRVRLMPGWCEPPILWTCIVGESGTMKTPAFRLAVEPLREAQTAAFRDHEHAMELYARDRAEHERATAAWKKTGRGDPPTPPVEPLPARCVVSDTTVEALAPILAANPRGVLLQRDELSGWLRGFDQYKARGGADVAHWLSIHNGESITVDRKSSGVIHVPSATISIAGGIQPAALRLALGVEHLENGLAARLLLAMPPRRPKRWTGQGIGPDVEAQYALLIDRLRELRADDLPDGPQPVDVPLSPDGLAAWRTFYDLHNQEAADLTGLMASVWSKLEACCARLALVMHYIRWADGEDVGEAIDAQDIAAGVELVRWFGREARRVYGVLAEDDADRDRRRLADLIAARGGSVSVRDWQRVRHHQSSLDAEAELRGLESAGYGRLTYAPQGGSRGRPSRVFTLCDVCDTDKNVADNGVDGVSVTVTRVTGEMTPAEGRQDRQVSGAGDQRGGLRPADRAEAIVAGIRRTDPGRTDALAELERAVAAEGGTP